MTSSDDSRFDAFYQSQSWETEENFDELAAASADVLCDAVAERMRALERRALLPDCDLVFLQQQSLQRFGWLLLPQEDGRISMIRQQDVIAVNLDLGGRPHSIKDQPALVVKHGGSVVSLWMQHGSFEARPSGLANKITEGHSRLKNYREQTWLQSVFQNRQRKDVMHRTEKPAWIEQVDGETTEAFFTWGQPTKGAFSKTTFADGRVFVHKPIGKAVLMWAWVSGLTTRPLRAIKSTKVCIKELKVGDVIYMESLLLSYKGKVTEISHHGEASPATMQLLWTEKDKRRVFKLPETEERIFDSSLKIRKPKA